MGLLRNDPHPGAAEPAAYGAVRALTAAAQRVHIDDRAEVERVKQRRASDKWQEDAWEYFDLIGEVKYAFNLLGSVMSRIRLFPGVITGTDVAPSNARAVESLPAGVAASADAVIRRLDTAHGGQPGLLKDAAVNLAVAGECYLVQTPAKVGSNLPETWSIKSVDELVTMPNGGFGLKKRRTAQQATIEPLVSTAYVGRIWRMHPRYSDEADASMRSLLDLCDELLLLGRTVRATARSRLNAGALFVPEELSVSRDAPEDVTDPNPDDSIQPVLPMEETDSFEEELLDSMTTPISDEESASAVVPLLIRGPAELGKDILHIKFERAFDAQLTVRYDRVLERILQGIDMPKDIVTGLANIKYSNAVQIEESLYKQHVEPMALLLCDALTVVYLRPALRSLGYAPEIVDKMVVWYDPSEIVTAPDKAGAANIGHQNFSLSSDAWRKANGFTDADAPTPEEVATRVAVQRGQLSDAVTEALFKMLIPGLMEKIRQDNINSGPTGGLPPGVQEILDGPPGGGGPPPQPTNPNPPLPAQPATPTPVPEPAPA